MITVRDIFRHGEDYLDKEIELLLGKKDKRSKEIWFY